MQHCLLVQGFPVVAVVAGGSGGPVVCGEEVADGGLGM